MADGIVKNASMMSASSAFDGGAHLKHQSDGRAPEDGTVQLASRTNFTNTLQSPMTHRNKCTNNQNNM